MGVNRSRHKVCLLAIRAIRHKAWPSHIICLVSLPFAILAPSSRPTPSVMCPCLLLSVLPPTPGQAVPHHLSCVPAPCYPRSLQQAHTICHVFLPFAIRAPSNTRSGRPTPSALCPCLMLSVLPPAPGQAVPHHLPCVPASCYPCSLQHQVRPSHTICYVSLPL